MEKILNDKTWKCLACNTTILKTSKLFPRSTKEQLRNVNIKLAFCLVKIINIILLQIYNLYPANTVNNCAKEQIQEIHVMNLKDIQNNGK